MSTAVGPASETPSGGPVFADAVRWVIDVAEGGARLITDTGGMTRFGISQNRYPTLDIENLTRQQAEALYLRDFWRPIKGAALPPALALVLFDAAVNMGPPTAVRILQTVLRHVTVDGVMGPETVSAAKMYLPRTELVAQVMRLRNSWYRDLAAKSEKHARYLFGWEMRLWRLALEAGMWRGL